MPFLAFFLCLLAFHSSQAGQASGRAEGEGRPNPAQSGPAREFGAERAADVVALRNALLALQEGKYPGARMSSVRGTLAGFRIVSHERLPDGAIRAVVEFRSEAPAPSGAPVEPAAPSGPSGVTLDGEAALLTGYLNHAAALDREISDCRRRLVELRAWRESAVATERAQISAEMTEVSRELAAAWHDRSALENNTLRQLESHNRPASTAPAPER